MSDALRFQLQGLLEAPALRVRQHVEPLQVLVNWDQANKYEVSTLDGRPVLWAAEEPRGMLGALSRNFNPFYKNATECVTLDGTVALTVEFPWALFLRRGNVLAWDGRLMATVQQRFTLFSTRFDVLSPGGAVQLSIRGPAFRFVFWRDWVFDVFHGEQLVAQIKRQFPGWLKEAFTNADNFQIEFEAGLVDGRLRQLVLASTLALDLTRFEHRERGAVERLLTD